MRRSAGTDRRHERGVVIIWTAFFLMTMLGFVAIGIDVAKLMATRTQLQNAADAAALAGASAIDPTLGVIAQDSAVVRATAIAVSNKAFIDQPKSIVLNPADVSFPTPNRVKVTVRRDPASGGSMITHVAQVLGITSLQVSATAVAEAETASSVCEGVVPMAAIEDPADPFLTGCGKQYQLKGDAPGPGNFQLLDFPTCDEGACTSGGGAAYVRCLVANGYGCCVDIGQCVNTKPGASFGPFRQGLTDRWNRDTDRREGICYDEYQGNGQRIVIVPLIRTWDPVGASQQVCVEGFLAFFMQYHPSGGGSGQRLIGQFMNVVVPGEGGGGSVSGPVVYVLRLVQ